MKKHISVVTVITLILAIVSIVVSASNVDKIQTSSNRTKAAMSVATSDEENTEEMRGLWVSYISLDMNSQGDYSQEAFEDKFKEIVQTAKLYRCNTIFAHVRPFCDALYKSDIFPPSHILSGEQGKSVDYDALEIMCEIAHSEGIQLHAWINPYRVTSVYSDFSLSDNNPYVNDKETGVTWENAVYLNPAKSKVRELIADGVAEIAENYDIDGIHFDDYFYPTADYEFDADDYGVYLQQVSNSDNALPVEDWRKNNINLMVAQVYQTIKSIDDSIAFGISPQGNIQNDLDMGADVESWAEYIGYVDYLCPQLYYSLNNPALRFEDCLNNWIGLTKHEKLKLYVGLGVYKAGTDMDEGTWLDSDTVLRDQLEMIRNKNLDGYALYDYESIISETAKKEMTVFKNAL